ncbi:replication initiation factor domain-containing protein [Geomonas oryzae]|uniref:replication initiation factor domain-containing protein n=1 Tax=Geomonas oryzae TaxID=2364273 RepID=UPI00100BC121|nr:replication initiation factor domain-containing protein [Geomonas oryzae]
MEVKTGIDRLHLTVSTSYSLETVISTLFEGLTLETHFRKVKNKLNKSGTCKGRTISWYRTSYYLENSENNKLVAIHTDHVSKLGKRNLVQIHGLTFSESALNSLRPINLEKLIGGAITMDASISACDVYLDVIGGKIPINQIRVQSLPHNYRSFIRSPFIRDRKNARTLPRPIGDSSIYYGGKGGNMCQILLYQKHLDPHQKIYSEDNPLKFSWVRFELRLRKATAKRQMDVIQNLFPIFPEDQKTLGEIVADLFTRYFNFVEPTSNRVSRCPPQPWWEALLATARTTPSCNTII